LGKLIEEDKDKNILKKMVKKIDWFHCFFKIDPSSVIEKLLLN